MADIELVVKIPEEAYKLLKNEGVDWLGAEHILNAVANGTPLPKGHGRLKDVDNIKTAFPSGEYVRTESIRATIDHEETILEADKAERSDRE